MQNWQFIVNLSIGVAGLVLTSLGLLMAILYRPIDAATRRYFLWFFGLLIVYTASIIIFYVAIGVWRAGGVARASIFLESLSSSMLMPLLTVYLIHLSGEPWRKNPLYSASVGLWLAYVALLIYTQFSTAIYTVDDAGAYSRGPLYPLLLAPPAMILALNLHGLWRRRGRLTSKQRAALLAYLLTPLAGTVIQALFYGVQAIALGTVIAALVMFAFLISDQQELFIRQTEENAQKEFDIRILQMRPHFIYNALTSIYYITQENPEKGLRVIRDFTVYLRRVFHSVTLREPIPFEEELAHTRAYLSVEQARFEDQLCVTFDTPHTDFRLPPLTLQPIVENAVKHGMDPELERLHLTIQTRAVASGSQIIVENDGVEYLPSAGEEGVGLASTEARLRRMCGGSLRLSPRPGGGAVVTVLIPETKK